MATDPTAVTRETLAARLDALEQENRDLRAQLVARPDSVPSRAKPVPMPIRERVSRRGMLRRGLQAAAVRTEG